MRILIRPKPKHPAATESIQFERSTIRVPSRPLRVLDFDIENRPLTYLGSDFTTAEVTAISWAWVDAPDAVTVYLLGETDLPVILAEFLKVYQSADLIVGHYIRGHDLPMVNGALMECQMPALPDKMTHDTKLDLIRAKGISQSQESLGAMLKIDAPKVTMNQSQWRAANRLTPEGLALVRTRVMGDVRQNVLMRKELLALGYLKPPVLWRSGTATLEPYAP